MQSLRSAWQVLRTEYNLSPPSPSLYVPKHVCVSFFLFFLISLLISLHALSLATLFCVSPPGGTLLPGTEPTVDTVPMQPIPAYWYYVMAAGGAVLVLVSVALALVLHYHRFRYAAKKTDHSITYKTSHYTNGAPLAVEPTLTIKLEQDRGSHC